MRSTAPRSGPIRCHHVETRVLVRNGTQPKTLDTVFVSKLKYAMSEIPGKFDPWGEREKTGNATDSGAVRGYLSRVQVELHPVGVEVSKPDRCKLRSSCVLYGTCAIQQASCTRWGRMSHFTRCNEGSIWRNRHVAGQILSIPGGTGVVSMCTLARP